METPSSTARRITRSQTASNNIPVSRKMNEDAEKSVSKTRQQQQQDRCALVDISNDSPIVGLAKGKDMETPLSSMTKKKRAKTTMTTTTTTPGSGEALLRGQVKTLLQKVEEEAVISKLSMEKVVPYSCFLKLASSSPMSLLLAPTPANTPQVPNLSGLPLVSPPSCVVEEQLISRVVNEIFEGKNEESGDECEKNVISRSLLLDFSDKSEVSECSSEVTSEEVTQGSVVVSGITEDDGSSSVWSIQVNASSMQDEDEDNEEMGEEEEEEEDYYEDDDAEDDDGDFGGLSLDELCAGLNSISVNENKIKGCGKHTRFVYDSEDDEVVEKVVEECCAEDNVMDAFERVAYTQRKAPSLSG